MALSELERKRVEKFAFAYVDVHRPAANIRAQLDIGFRIPDQSQWSKIATIVILFVSVIFFQLEPS